MMTQRCVSRWFLEMVPLILIGLAIFLGCGNGGNSGPQALPGGDPNPDDQLLNLETNLFELVNQHRQGQGLDHLQWSDTIVVQCRAHSAAMAAGTTALGHDGFDERLANIAAVIDYGGAAENVAVNYGFSDPATQAFQGWLNSSGHRQNMEGRFDLTALGAARSATGETYFTQIFIQSR